jgi:hypothetical protein
MDLMERVENDFHSSGLPLHVGNPANLLFRVMSLEEFDHMSEQELQALYACYHLVVTGYPKPSFGFDTKGLVTLAPSYRVFTIQGVYACLEAFQAELLIS